MFNQYYDIYLADTMELREIEYYIAEFFAQVVCRAGHSYLLIPKDNYNDDGGLYNYVLII